jgi:hypothetical protein
MKAENSQEFWRLADVSGNRNIDRESKAEQRRDASAKHDAQFFKDRKATEEKNLALTLKLRAQRLAHEATQPKVATPGKKSS